MKHFIAVIAFAASSASAGTFGVHIGSHHMPDRGYTNFNPGVYYRHDSGWTAGAYHNSFDKLSTYAGYEFREVYGLPVAIQVGIVTGYRRSVQPVVAPVALLPHGFRLTVLPKVEPKGAWVIHLSKDL